MLHMRKLLHNHELVNASAQRIANAIDVVEGQVDQHDVLGAVFDAGVEGVGESLILIWGGASLDGPGDWVRDDSTRFFFDQDFRAGADDLEVVTV